MSATSHCDAIRLSTGDYQCRRCRLSWDHDEEKPPCLWQRQLQPVAFQSGLPYLEVDSALR